MRLSIPFAMPTLLPLDLLFTNLGHGPLIFALGNTPLEVFGREVGDFDSPLRSRLRLDPTDTDRLRRD